MATRDCDIMVLYTKIVSSASVGATAGTFDKVGDVQVRNDATKLLGFWVIAEPTVNLAAIEFTGQLQIQSNDLSMSPQTFPCPPFMGGAPATNVGFSAHKAQFVPMVKTLKGKEVISIYFSQGVPSNATACSVVVALVYDAKTPTALGTEEMASWPLMSPISSGCQISGQASITTVAETALPSITIPSWATEICGIAAYVMPNLMTAGEEVVGSVTLRSTLTDFDSQEWPFVASIAPPLGTPVGKGAELQEMAPMAAFFPLDGKNNTITPYVKLNVAVTTGHAVFVAIYYR